MQLMKRNNKKGDKSEPAERALAKPGEWSQGLSRLREEVDQAIERAWRAFENGLLPAMPEIRPWPPMDVSEDEKTVTIRVDVPGMSASDIDVEVSGNQLTVKGKRGEEKTEKDGGVRRHERRTGEFLRSITLPAYADAEKVDARYDTGILTISVPKIVGKGPRRVAVKAE
jgi:HSP20 family protein